MQGSGWIVLPWNGGFEIVQLQISLENWVVNPAADQPIERRISCQCDRESLGKGGRDEWLPLAQVVARDRKAQPTVLGQCSRCAQLGGGSTGVQVVDIKRGRADSITEMRCCRDRKLS